MDRLIECATEKNDIVFDPFGGSGTTYIAAELKGRRWIGAEIGSIKSIVNRFKNLDADRELLIKYREDYNKLFPPKLKSKRKKLALWTEETFN